MASAGLHTETLRHNAYFPFKNASTHATPQGTLLSLIGVTARHAYILQQTNKPDRYLTTPKLLTKSNSAT